MRLTTHALLATQVTNVEDSRIRNTYMLNKNLYQGLLKNLAKEQRHQLARLTTTMRSIRSNLSYSMTSAKFSDPSSQSCLDCWEGAWVRRGKEST